ncbi:MAG: hypothetical protein JW927_05480 [Deltaproteobacteria bacterium]|nr:hypothetical protein [Deltaproteobacteria bacterium]
MNEISTCRKKWCNKNVLAFGLTSFLSDFCHEMATSILPQFLSNVVYCAVSYPIGALSSRFTRSRYLAAGYCVAVITFAGFTFVISSIWWFMVFFSLAGIFIAWEDTVEGILVYWQWC